MPYDGRVLLGIPEAWGVFETETAAVHHEPEQIPVRIRSLRLT